MKPNPLVRALAPVLVAAALGRAAAAQEYPETMTFTIDGHGPTIALSDAFTSIPITEGDLLTPASGPSPGPNAPVHFAPSPPGILLSGGGNAAGPGLGLFAHSACVGHQPGTNCPVEVDALSFGRDYALPEVLLSPATLRFSVDEFATGKPGAPSSPPDVRSEGAANANEGATDLFGNRCPQVLGAMPPSAPPMGNAAMVDGNGTANVAGIRYSGTGLVEPTSTGLPPDLGDNLDGFDLATEFVPAGNVFPVFFSLDASFTDPINGFPLAASATAQGFQGADVLVTPGPGLSPVLFASAASLGLDLLGPGTDDLDALALAENGDLSFQPSEVPYDWLTVGGPDMLLYSVRRGSAVIGRPDSRFGEPIEPGDILSTPLPAALGGVSPYPSIFIAAEVLGLATDRADVNLDFGDDLDGLDAVPIVGFDCNNNCVPDKIDFDTGELTDANGNCIADECENQGNPFCFCAAGPCGNSDPDAGCANSTGGGAYLGASGSASVAADDLDLVLMGLPPNQFGIVFMGQSTASFPLGDGFRCVGGLLFRYPVVNSGIAGTATFGPVVGHANTNFPTPGHIAAGATWLFQGWYRDPPGPCGTGNNLTTARSISFVP